MEAAIFSKGYVLKQEKQETPENRLNKRLAEVDSAYANLIKEALEIAGGNKSQAAQLLGVSRRTFYRLMKKYC